MCVLLRRAPSPGTTGNTPPGRRTSWNAVNAKLAEITSVLKESVLSLKSLEISLQKLQKAPSTVCLWPDLGPKQA